MAQRKGKLISTSTLWWIEGGRDQTIIVTRRIASTVYPGYLGCTTSDLDVEHMGRLGTISAIERAVQDHYYTSGNLARARGPFPRHLSAGSAPREKGPSLLRSFLHLPPPKLRGIVVFALTTSARPSSSE